MRRLLKTIISFARMNKKGHASHGKGKGHGHDHEDNYLDKHKKLYEAADVSFDTFKVHHRKAYLKAVDERLTDDKGNVDYNRLDNDNVKHAFHRTMKDFYVKKVEDKLKSKIDEEWAREAIIRAWYGVDMKQLKDLIDKHGINFSLDFYERQLVPQIERTLHPQIYGRTTEHLKFEHLDDLTKKMGLEGKLKTPLELEGGKELLQAYSGAKGSLSDQALRQIVGHKLKKSTKKDDHGNHGHH